MEKRIKFEIYLLAKTAERTKKLRKEVRIRTGVRKGKIIRQEDISGDNRSSVSRLEAMIGMEKEKFKNFINPATPSLIEDIIKALKDQGKIIEPEELIFGKEDEEYKKILKFLFDELMLSKVSSEITDEEVILYSTYGDTYKEIREAVARVCWFNAELSLLKYELTKNSYYNFPIMKNENEIFSEKDKADYYLNKYIICLENSIDYILEREQNRLIKSFKHYFLKEKEDVKNEYEFKEEYDKKILKIGKAVTKWINDDLYKIMLEIETEYKNEAVLNIGYKIYETTSDVLEVIEINNDIHIELSNAMYEKSETKRMVEGKKPRKVNSNKTLKLLAKELESKNTATLQIENVYDDFIRSLKQIQYESLDIKKSGLVFGE